MTRDQPLAMMDVARFDAEAGCPSLVLLAGRGAIDLARPRFEVVGTDVPVTRISRRPLAAGPQGLDFGSVLG